MLYALNLRAVCRLYLNRKEGKDSENNKYMHNKGDYLYEYPFSFCTGKELI